MDKVTKYQQFMHSLMKEYYDWYSQIGSHPNVDLTMICDDTNGQYQLLKIGWRGEHRVRNQIFHIRLKNDKFWIEEDWTEEGIGTELMRLGVPREDIVLAYNPPEVRPYTDFAVA